MNKVKIESAKATCQKCGIVYGFDVQSQQEGFRSTQCPLCKHEQYVWLEFRAIVVPVPVGYAKRSEVNGRS